jgi:replication factor C large subunit
MAARYDLDAEHISFITGSGKDTNKVQSIVEDAQQLREELAAENADGAFEGDSKAAGIDDGSASDDADEDGDAGADEESSASAGQSTLTGEALEEGDDESANAENAKEDDQQAGLGDFV